jgi:multidrug efflux pump subunit AcrB
VEVDLNQTDLISHGLSAADVGHALASQNIVLPAGDEKVGAIDYFVATNSTPLALDEFDDLPIKQVGNAVVYLRDVAHVHRGGPPQQNIVLAKGHQSILVEILKSGDASTLAVVSGVKAKQISSDSGGRFGRVAFASRPQGHVPWPTDPFSETPAAVTARSQTTSTAR